MLTCHPKDANAIQQVFSSEKVPTLWHAIPALEDLLTAWEMKKEDIKYFNYHKGLEDSIDKIRKYYCQFDSKPTYVLSLSKSHVTCPLNIINYIYLVLHPFYKLL